MPRCDPDGQVSEVSAGRAATTPTPKILLAGGNVINQKILTVLLARRGYSTVGAPDVQRALDALRQGEFALVLLDAEPGEIGDSGAVAAIRELARAKGNSIPVVALVEPETEEDRAHRLAAGFDDHLPKPVQAERLWSVVEAHTSSSGRASAGAVMDRQAALDRVGGDREFLAEMTTLFLEGEYPRLMGEIRGAIEQGDAARLASAAHSMKNWVGNYVASSVFAAVEELEETARRGELSAIEAVHETFRRQIARLTPELAALAAGSKTPADSRYSTLG